MHSPWVHMRFLQLIWRVLFSWCPPYSLVPTLLLLPLPWVEFDRDIPFRDVCSKLSLCTMSGCGPLYLFPSVPGRKLASLMIYSIAEYHYESFLLLLSFRLCFYPRSLGYLVSGSWSPKQCQVWVLSHGMGLKSKQTLASYSYKLGATIFCALAYFASRTDCRSKVLWFGWCLYSSVFSPRG